MTIVVKAGLVALGLAAASGCTPRATLKVEPIKVEPIHVTVDVNVRVQREIDRTFDYLYGASEATPPAAPESGEVKR